MSYAHNNHWEWIDRNRNGKKPMSDLGKQVANILGYVGNGIYNCPINYEKVDWSDNYYLKVVWSRAMSNWDFLELSKLWVECHRRMVRVSVSAVAPGRLRLEFWQRKTREGGVGERLPDCETVIELIDGDFGRLAEKANETMPGTK